MVFSASFDVGGSHHLLDSRIPSDRSSRLERGSRVVDARGPRLRHLVHHLSDVAPHPRDLGWGDYAPDIGCPRKV